MKPLRLSAYTTVSALGRGNSAALTALRQETSGLQPCDFEDADLATWIGRVEGLETEPLTDEWALFDCRNNRLARLGLLQDGFIETAKAARNRHGANRLGVFIGTSTSGIQATELAYRDRDPTTGKLPAGFDYRHTHNIFSVADFTRQYLGLSGPTLAISTACSSSAKVFAAAYRYMQAGHCDAAIVGGVDSLCLITLYGFHSLGLVSSQLCRPWDTERDGLNVAEAAGFALLERVQPGDDGIIALLGYGESSDAYHMSTVHPEGAGAALAMQRALTNAGLMPSQVDYINLHGTATPANDAAEDKAINQVFGTRTRCSSTKGWTGHTLGAAGITEALFTGLIIEHGFIPANLNLQTMDDSLSANIVRESETTPVNIVMSNSFGFGGSNCSLIFGRLRG
ncbi:MAG: beta-ketoacyl-[acyl-carrier-protein] synthase family protein [Candidatus Competibacteraceae bacterium]|nr:beta-ketoacyl-[acyl-carrier-protein] synthase family protein [Candidatus Competibacteraceae bacterium]